MHRSLNGTDDSQYIYFLQNVYEPVHHPFLILSLCFRPVTEETNKAFFILTPIFNSPFCVQHQTSSYNWNSKSYREIYS